MENIKGPILLATLYLVLYGFPPFLGIVPLTSLLFFLSPIPVFWKVYKVLKDGVVRRFTGWILLFYEAKQAQIVGTRINVC